jgi:predicted aminopeptidase
MAVFNEVSFSHSWSSHRFAHEQQGSELQAEKRGNFVVVGCIEGSKVVSWSLNVSIVFILGQKGILTVSISQALNTSETLRLLACIELACYRCKQAVADPRSLHRSRRRVERVIKDDRRKRHMRRQEQDAMIDLFSKQDLNSPEEGP